jgi:hypothetical protein
MRRRLLLLVSAALACLTLQPAAAQAPLRYALLSAVGDQMTVVFARTQTGSRLDRNDREIGALPDKSLDTLVLKHLDSALHRTLKTAETAALAAANASLLAVQRDTLAGKRAPDAPVRAFADVLPEGGTDRLLMVLKHRAEARIPVAEGTIGLGRLEGVGFYVDRVTLLRSGRSGYTVPGFLAPFAYVRLVLADAQGRVIAEREIEAAQTFGMGDTPEALHPWDMMDSSGKMAALDRLLRAAIDRELPALLR